MENNSFNTTKIHHPAKTGISTKGMAEKYHVISPMKHIDQKETKQNQSSNDSLFKYKKLKRQPSMNSNMIRHRILLKNYFVNFQMPLITRKGDRIDDDNVEEDRSVKLIKRLKYKINPQLRNKPHILMKNVKILFNSELISSSPLIKKNLTISSIIVGQLSNLSMGVVNENYKNYSKPIKSNDVNSTDYIRAFAANTYQGLHNDKNYNKVLVILKVSQPERKLDQEWPCCSIFGLFDGMDGDKCSEYLRNELHQYIMKENMFPRGMDKAMIEGYEKADLHFLKSIIQVPECQAVNKSQTPSKIKGQNYPCAISNEAIIDTSGSCALEIFFMNFICYIANVGDSKVFLIKNHLEEYEQITTVHNSTNSHENKRIIRNGGTFKTLQVQMSGNSNSSGAGLHLPCYEYVFPGNSRTTRVMGRIEGKLKRNSYNGNILIATPDVISLRIRRDIDFVLVGNYELFTKLTMKDILECMRMIFNNNTSSYNCNDDIHSQCSLAVELIIKTALHREIIGNVSCILIMIRK